MGLLKNDSELNNTIVLSVNESKAPYLEAIADEIITPGMLLSITPPTGGAMVNVSKFAGGAGATCQRIFATENTRDGGTISDDYAAGDRVMFRACRSGDVVLSWLDASSTAVVVGSYVCPSATAGYLTNIADTTPVAGSTVGVVLTPSVGAVAQLIKIQVW